MGLKQVELKKLGVSFSLVEFIELRGIVSSLKIRVFVSEMARQ